MLFSNEQIAAQINASFEPVWVSVRDVPIVRIDFGGGNVLTRTLHGNIATYVCTSDGAVLDVMPGVYEPATYAQRLRQFAMLHRHVTQDAPGGDPAARLRTYHQTQATALARGEPAHVFDFGRPARRNGRPADFSKTLRIEGPLKLVLQPAPPVVGNTATGTPAASESALTAGVSSERGRSLWESLREDTRVNESTRRRAIHEHLAKAGRVVPDDITLWLYREVLHADLDDPYLGLGETLFATYPFREEDVQ